MALETFALEIDLSFSGFHDKALIEPDYKALKPFLTESELWLQEIKRWVHFFHCNINLKCPDVVRERSTFSLGIQLTDDLTIARLNKYWRNKSESTDVLAFPALDDSILIPSDQFVELGDIVVSVITAERQAKDNNHGLAIELRWLVSHGFLHLLGWDHQNEEDLKEMLTCQEHLMDIDGNVQPCRSLEV